MDEKKPDVKEEVTLEELKKQIAALTAENESLKKDSEKLNRVVEFLMEHETMSGSQFVACMEGKQIGEAEKFTLFENPGTEA